MRPGDCASFKLLAGHGERVRAFVSAPLVTAPARTRFAMLVARTRRCCMMRRGAVRRTLARAAAATIACIATGGAVCAALAAAAPGDVCTLHPGKHVPGAFGAAVALSEGRLWVGPARDRDIGVGSPQVRALGLATAGAPCAIDPHDGLGVRSAQVHPAFGKVHPHPVAIVHPRARP